jgi:type I restriction enzyme, S subunit
VPAHWEIKRLKYISPRITVGIVITPAAYYCDEGILALRGLNIKTMSFDLSDVRNISTEGHGIKTCLQVPTSMQPARPGSVAL